VGGGTTMSAPGDVVPAELGAVVLVGFDDWESGSSSMGSTGYGPVSARVITAP
jgi:hypothetical protein